MRGPDANIITAYSTLFTVVAGVLVAELTPLSHLEILRAPKSQASTPVGLVRNSEEDADPADLIQSSERDVLSDKSERVARARRVTRALRPGRS